MPVDNLLADPNTTESKKAHKMVTRRDRAKFQQSEQVPGNVASDKTTQTDSMIVEEPLQDSKTESQPVAFMNLIIGNPHVSTKHIKKKMKISHVPSEHHPVEVMDDIEALGKIKQVDELLSLDSDYDEGETESSEAETCDTMEEIFEVYNDEEIEYYNNLPEEETVLIKEQEIAIQSYEKQEVPLRFRVLRSDMDMRLKALIVQKLNHLSTLEYGSSEYAKSLGYVTALSRIPLGVYKQPAIKLGDSTPDEIGSFLGKAQKCLDDCIFGQSEIKHQFVMMIAKWIANPSSKGLVIGIEGSAGVGKTSIVKDGLCKALDMPFSFIPLGGANDASFLDGHSYTYEGSVWGKIVDSLMLCKCMNPVLCFDELDKVADNYRGHEIFNVLTHLTDSTQNDSFCDKYFADLPLDISKSIIVFTYNDASKIPHILKDRMICMTCKSYSVPDKLAILNDFIIPKTMAAYNISTEHLVFPREVLQGMITSTPAEGMRDLKRQVECIASHINMMRMLPNNMMQDYASKLKIRIDDVKFPFCLTEKLANAFTKGLKRDQVNIGLLNHMYL